MKIILNNKEKEVKKNTSIYEAFKEEIENSKFPVIGAVFNNEYKRLDDILEKNGELLLVDISTNGGIKIYRRTLIFILAMAFERIYKDAKIRINYQLSNSMFCSIDNMEVTKEMLKLVQTEMENIVSKNIPIICKKMTREEAKALYEKDDSYKGRLQLDLTNNKIINMYYCEDYYNYIYEDIAINTGITNVFELVKYDGRIFT